MLLDVLKVTVSASITSVSKSLLPSLILNTNKIIKTTNKPDVAVLATNAAIALQNSRRRLFFQIGVKAGIVGTCVGRVSEEHGPFCSLLRVWTYIIRNIPPQTLHLLTVGQIHLLTRCARACL